VLATQTIINQEVFATYIDISRPGGVVLYSNDSDSISANSTFIGRTVSNATIIDEYSIGTLALGEVGTFTQTIRASKINNGYIPIILLENVFNFALDKDIEPSLKIKALRFAQRDAGPASSIDTIFSGEKDLTLKWDVGKSQFYPSYSTYCDCDGSFRLFIGEINNDKVEIAFRTVIPPQSSIYDNPNGKIVIQEGVLPPLSPLASIAGDNLILALTSDDDTLAPFSQLRTDISGNGKYKVSLISNEDNKSPQISTSQNGQPISSAI
jgi:hypothetical protein